MGPVGCSQRMTTPSSPRQWFARSRWTSCWTPWWTLRQAAILMLYIYTPQLLLLLHLLTAGAATTVAVATCTAELPLHGCRGAHLWPEERIAWQGNTYERAAILAHLRRDLHSPLSRSPLTAQQLVSATLRQSCILWLRDSFLCWLIWELRI